MESCFGQQKCETNLPGGIKMTNSCKGCIQRTPGCHDNCISYQHWKKILNDKNNWLKEQREVLRASQDLYWQRIKNL